MILFVFLRGFLWEESEVDRVVFISLYSVLNIVSRTISGRKISLEVMSFKRSVSMFRDEFFSFSREFF